MRKVLSVVGGFLTWWIVASLLSRGLKMAWPDYAVAEPAMHFTLAMLLSRLVMGAGSTLAAGWVTFRISNTSRGAVLGLGIIMLIFFIPVHVKLFAVFPIWYHLVFLGSLVPLAMAPWAWRHWRSQPGVS